MLSRKRLIFAAIAGGMVCLVIGSALVSGMRARAIYEERQHAVYERFDPERPGRGVLDYPGNPVGDVAKSYAMILLGELTREDRGQLPTLASLLGVSGNWLLNNPNIDQAGHIGWGLPVAWDAYGDGSENPADTIYSISTAIVVDALLTWREQESDAPGVKIAELVAASLDDFVAVSTTPDGLLPYSLTQIDQPYDTFNSAAYLAGQMQRFGKLVGDERYLAVADRTMESLIRNRQISAAGHWYWKYSIQEARSNDLPHASYIIKGISDYVAYGGRLAGYFDMSAIRGILNEYLQLGQDDETWIRAWPAFETDVTLPARLYDVGMALSLACSEPEIRALRGPLLDTVDSYKVAGGYLKYPAGTEGMIPLIINEYEAYLWYGLAKCS